MWIRSLGDTLGTLPTPPPQDNRSFSLGVCGPGFGLEAGPGAWLWIGVVGVEGPVCKSALV